MQLIRIGLEHPDIRYEIFYGASDNARGWWDNGAAFRFGYRPQGRAEDHSAAALAADAEAAARSGRRRGIRAARIAATNSTAASNARRCEADCRDARVPDGAEREAASEDPGPRGRRARCRVALGPGLSFGSSGTSGDAPLSPGAR